MSIYKCKKWVCNHAETVFGSKRKSGKTEEEQEKERLIKTIGVLKAENDFLKNALR